MVTKEQYAKNPEKYKEQRRKQYFENIENERKNQMRDIETSTKMILFIETKFFYLLKNIIIKI